MMAVVQLPQPNCVSSVTLVSLKNGTRSEGGGILLCTGEIEM